MNIADIVRKLPDSTLERLISGADHDIKVEVAQEIGLAALSGFGSASIPAPAPRGKPGPKPRATTAAAPVVARARPAKANGVAPVSKPNGASKSSAPKAKGQKRDPDELASLIEQLFDHIKTSPGQGIEQIGKGLVIPTKDLVLPIKKLLKEGRIRTEGEKRATRYYPVSGKANGAARIMRKAPGARSYEPDLESTSNGMESDEVAAE